MLNPEWYRPCRSDSDACCSVSVAGGNAQSGILPRRPRFHADYAELFALGYTERALQEMKYAQVLPVARYTKGKWQRCINDWERSSGGGNEESSLLQAQIEQETKDENL